MAIYYDYDKTGVQYDWIELNEVNKTVRYGNSGTEIPDTHNLECIYVRELDRLIIPNIHKYKDITKKRKNGVEIMNIEFDKLQKFVNESIEYDNEVIMYSQDTVLVKMNKLNHIEYAVFRYNDKGCYNGSYYSTRFDTDENAYELAKLKFKELIF